MQGLPDFSKKLIEDRVDVMFALMVFWSLGVLPEDKKLREYVLASVPMSYTLSNIFVQGLRNRQPNMVEQDGLKGLIRGASNYFDALKLKTKTNLINQLNGYVTDQKKKGLDVEDKALSKLIDAEMDKAKEGFDKIVDTEASNFRGTAVALDIAGVANSIGDTDPTVYFNVILDEKTCQWCKQNHLMPDLRTPRYYRLSEVKSSYVTNQERKDGVVGLAGLHPNCRCEINYLPKDYTIIDGQLKHVSPNHDALKEQRKPNE